MHPRAEPRRSEPLQDQVVVALWSVARRRAARGAGAGRTADGRDAPRRLDRSRRRGSWIGLSETITADIQRHLLQAIDVQRQRHRRPRLVPRAARLVVERGPGALLGAAGRVHRCADPAVARLWTAPSHPPAVVAPQIGEQREWIDAVAGGRHARRRALAAAVGGRSWCRHRAAGPDAPHRRRQGGHRVVVHESVELSWSVPPRSEREPAAPAPVQQAVIGAEAELIAAAGHAQQARAGGAAQMQAKSGSRYESAEPLPGTGARPGSR